MSKMPKNKNARKRRLRTAMEVVRRVIWDDDIPQDCITIGYLDRFLGVLEKPFTEFSWEPLDSLDYFTFGVPEHRIQYFKYNDLVVWDKNSRLDYVFGSAGSGKTIDQVIKDYDELVRDTGPVNSDFDDDGVVVTVEHKSNMDVENESDSGEDNVADDDGAVRWENKLRPTYFICQRVTDQEFLRKSEGIVDSICEYVPLYRNCSTGSTYLHLTLATVLLNNSWDVQCCVKALEEARVELVGLRPKDSIPVKGLGNFDGRVLYAAVELTHDMAEFANHLNLVLRSNGFVTDDFRAYVPHISLIKVSRPASKKLGTKVIHSNLYDEFVDTDFGHIYINKLHLCKMGKSHSVNNFYETACELILDDI